METLVSYDPRTTEPVGEVPVTAVEEIPVVMDRSRKAQAAWGGLSHEERRRYLKDFKRVILDRGEEIAELVSAETGKPLVNAYSTDVLPALVVLDHYARNAEKYLKHRHASAWPFLSTKAWTEYQPRGVAAVISPWNYPFFLPMIPITTALSAGCSTVLKPSEITPLTGQLVADLAAHAGLPPDLVQVIHGAGDVGSALIDAGPDVVAFTGSTRVGKLVAQQAARTLTPVVLELGGNDAMAVLEDADLSEAARGAVWGGMVNAGQTCVAVERLYVVDKVYDRFLSELELSFDTVACASDDRHEIGPIIHQPQIEVIERQVADAVSKGARIIRGGQRAEGTKGIYYEPTLMVDVDHSMEIMQEETFGPILPVVRVPDEAAALAMVNDTRYGLHGSVWTRDRRRGERFASSFKSGTVAINDVAVNFIVPGVSFAGIGDSGSGASFGPDGIHSFCHPKSITSARLPRPTLSLLGARFPRYRGMGYWKTLAKALFRW